MKKRKKDMEKGAKERQALEENKYTAAKDGRSSRRIQRRRKRKNKGQLTVNMSYASGEEGHCAKDCKAAAADSKQATAQQQVQPDPTAIWRTDSRQAKDKIWWYGGQAHVQTEK